MSTKDSQKNADRPDLHPTFWSNYVEPGPLARAIMYPLNDPKYAERVVGAYVQEWRNRNKVVDRDDPE